MQVPRNHSDGQPESVVKLDLLYELEVPKPWTNGRTAHEHAAFKLEGQDRCRVRLRYGNQSRRRDWTHRPIGQETFSAQQHGKIIDRTAEVFVERHEGRIHHWPVRWR